MEVGIGLPNAIPGLDARRLVEWARSAEERGFATLGTIDRLVYPSHEPMVALTAAASVTERVRLMSDILIAPLRRTTAMLAKQAVSLDNLSGGRFTLGAAPGIRDDDYAAAGVDYHRRGSIFDEQLAEMRRIWAGEAVDGAGPVGPPPAREGGPELMLGGSVDAAFRRAAQHGIGWTMGGGTPDQLRDARQKLEAAWEREGRSGSPRTSALAYFSLGSDARENAEWYIHHYYGSAAGREVAEQILGSVAMDDDTVAGYVQAFEDAGADEVVFFPCSTDPEQVERLAGAVGDRLR